MLRAALGTGADALLLATDDARPESDALEVLECIPAPRVWQHKGLVDFCLRRFGPPGEQSTRKA
jgi:hypothetical protein